MVALLHFLPLTKSQIQAVTAATHSPLHPARGEGQGEGAPAASLPPFPLCRALLRKCLRSFLPILSLPQPHLHAFFKPQPILQ